MGTTESLAMIMAARMAVATSLEVLMPRPMWPSESPMTTMLYAQLVYLPTKHVWTTRTP